MKVYRYNEMLEEELKNSKFRKEYEALEEEFDVARQIIELRLEAGMTQQELAQKAHTSQPCIARLESGKYQNLSLSFLRKVGKAIGARPIVTFRKSKAIPLHRLRRSRKSMQPRASRAGKSSG